MTVKKNPCAGRNRQDSLYGFGINRVWVCFVVDDVVEVWKFEDISWSLTSRHFNQTLTSDCFCLAISMQYTMDFNNFYGLGKLVKLCDDSSGSVVTH